MADHADVAQDAIELLAAEAERRARGKSKPETHPDFDGVHCVDCDDDIPAGRLVLGKVRCVYCQALLERVRV